jgi:hypothetical protein
MTKIITRAFDSAEQARNVRSELIRMQNFSPRIVGLYDDANGLADALSAAHVDATTAKEYEKRVKKGGAVVLVRAGYRPLGVAQTTRDVVAEMGAVDMGDLVEEVYVNEGPERFSNSILLDHPRLLTRNRVPGSTTYHMANWPIPLISRRKPMTESIIEPHAYMADKPIGHLVPHETRYGRFPFDLLIPGSPFMAKFPFAHLVPGHKFMAKFPFAHLIPGHKHMAGFPFGHLVPGHKFMAKFPFGHLVPGGMRMANWPFPLLINGKPGTNSLVPGQKYMAKFPIDHLVPGHKHQAGFPIGHIVPGHKHQANFPIPLLSKRKPADRFAFPRHARMADFILPLITKSDRAAPDVDKRWSFSRMLGLPTLKPR